MENLAVTGFADVSVEPRLSEGVALDIPLRNDSVDWVVLPSDSALQNAENVRDREVFSSSQHFQRVPNFRILVAVRSSFNNLQRTT